MVFGLYSDRNSWVIYIPLPLPGIEFLNTHICLYLADIWFWNFSYILCVADILKPLYSPNSGWNLWSLVRSFINGLRILVNEILAWLTFLDEYFFLSLYGKFRSPVPFHNWFQFWFWWCSVRVLFPDFVFDGGTGRHLRVFPFLFFLVPIVM